jgi:hypothetical protein
MAQGILRIFVLFAIGAIIYDVLTHPKGTQAAFGGVGGLLRTGLSASSGRNVK